MGSGLNKQPRLIHNTEIIWIFYYKVIVLWSANTRVIINIIIIIQLAVVKYQIMDFGLLLLGHEQLGLIQRWHIYTVESVYTHSPLRHDQLAVIQRWPAYTVEAVYSGHP